MLFVIDNTAVEMTVEELLEIVEHEKFEEFFDFLMECEEEASMLSEIKAWQEITATDTEASESMDNIEGQWAKIQEDLMLLYGGKEIRLTEKQEEMVVEGLTQKGDTDGDILFSNMSEDDIVSYIMGNPSSDQQDDETDIEERIRGVIRRLK